MVWADFSPNYLLSSDSSVYFNKLQSNTSSGSAHSKSKSQTKNIRTTWNSIDPNGYSMGSKSNMNPNLMKFITQHSEAACWNYQNLIPHTVPTLHYSSQLIVKKCVTRYQKNKWNHLNIQMSENLTPCSNDSPLYSNILHSFNYTIIHSAARASSSIFSPLSHSPLVLPRKGC